MLNAPFDLEKTKRNTEAVASFAHVRRAVPGGASYFQALDALQFREPMLSPTKADSPGLMFSYERPGGAALRTVLLTSPQLPDKATSLPLPEVRRVEVTKVVDDAFRLLRELSPGADHLVRTLLALLVVTRVDGVASASFASALGVAWLSPGRTWTATDYAEHLLHEACHQELFLDEMVNGLFARSRAEMLADADAVVQSPIRGTPRSYAASYHATAVGVYLVWLFHGLDLSQRARELVRGLRQAFEDLIAKKHYLTAAGLSRLGCLREGFESYAVHLM